MPARFYFLTLPLSALVASFLILALARILWSVTAFGLLAHPIFFIAMLLSLTLILSYILLGYLLLRGPSFHL
jgi:hypothetical protein